MFFNDIYFVCQQLSAKPLFAMTLFLDLAKKNWFAATNFCGQASSTFVSFLYPYAKDKITAINIRDDETLAKNF